MFISIGNLSSPSTYKTVYSDGYIEIGVSKRDRYYVHKDAEILLVIFGSIYKDDLSTEEISKAIIRLCNNRDYEKLTFFDGCFLVVVYDKFSKKLDVITDKFACFPSFYYCGRDNSFFFNRLYDVKENINSNINYESLIKYLSFGYVPGEETVMNNVIRQGGVECIVIATES